MQIYCIMLQFTNTHMSFPSIPFLTAYKWFPLCERSELYFISVDWNPGRFDNNCKKSDKIVKNLKNYITPSNFQSHLYKCKKKLASLAELWKNCKLTCFGPFRPQANQWYKVSDSWRLNPSAKFWRLITGR